MGRTGKRKNGGSELASPTAPTKRKRTTIQDVALAAGVSAMTVSNVINGKLSSVSEETRRRVLTTIEELNYRLLSSGRNLRVGNRQAVSVIVVDESPTFLSHPYISRMLSGLCGVLNRDGYAMMVQGIRPEEFASTFALGRAEADGYCIRLHGSREVRAEMLDVLNRVPEPIVLVQEELAITGSNKCVVRQDDRGGSRLIADHLAARGVTRLLVLAPRFSGSMTEARLQGLKEGFAATRSQVEMPLVVCDLNTYEDAYATLSQSFSSPTLPQAIFGTNDELALAALRFLQDRQIRVPEDVMVVGFNGFNPPGYTRPDLTTVMSCAMEVGATAAQCLLGHFQTGEFEKSEIVLPVTFRLGKST